MDCLYSMLLGEVMQLLPRTFSNEAPMSTFGIGYAITSCVHERTGNRRQDTT
jgi:hypothetical protein